ncbi:MAG: cupin domain-containing protein [Pirellulales bacterium]|nr:cupin domain-containing protein [Pirellulales bacterium]
MAIPHAHAGERIHLPLGEKLVHERTTTLVKTDRLEVIRLVEPAGKQISAHQVSGPITVQCLEGRVMFSVGNRPQELVAGDFLYLNGNESHSLEVLENSSLLLTIFFNQS